jgi:hypothetical protein
MMGEQRVMRLGEHGAPFRLSNAAASSRVILPGSPKGLLGIPALPPREALSSEYRYK